MKKLQLDELNRLSVDQFKGAAKIPVSLVLDNIRSLHNVGSAFRTADAFRIEKIYLTGITGTPPHREIEKTALGATASVDWAYVEKPEDVVRALKESGYQVVVVEQTTDSVPLNTFRVAPDQKYALVFGNEVKGVSEEVIALGDWALEVPQVGTKHSLNISVCLGIVLWEVFKQQQLER
ncbi:MAG: RNA methyltransferase [Cyclobacteriaceae bacterium]|nr:RNA methyltransferase [Flammeovirgaceae bacterium]